MGGRRVGWGGSATGKAGYDLSCFPRLHGPLCGRRVVCPGIPPRALPSYSDVASLVSGYAAVQPVSLADTGCPVHALPPAVRLPACVPR